jgi:hypothetical protein
VNPAASNRAKPTIVTSNWRSDTKIAAGRQGTDLAGIMATAKHVIASARAVTISSEPRSVEPSAFTGVRRTIEAPSVFEILIFGTATLGLASALRSCFFLGLAWPRTGFFARARLWVCMARGCCTCAGDGAGANGRGAGVGVDLACALGVALGAGFGLGLGLIGGAGSGVGSVGVGAVVAGGGSSATAAERPAGRISATAQPAQTSARSERAKQRHSANDKLVVLRSRNSYCLGL